MGVTTALRAFKFLVLVVFLMFANPVVASGIRLILTISLMKEMARRCRILCLHGFAMRGSNINDIAAQVIAEPSEKAITSSGNSLPRPPVPGSAFLDYLSPLRTACADSMILVAPSALHHCANDALLRRLAPDLTETDIEKHRDSYRVWWNYKYPTERNKRHQRELVGLQSSLEVLTSMILSDDESFDGIMGYSQGGVAASFLCLNPAIQQRLKFAVMIGALADVGTNAPKFSSLQPIPIPSLHVWGKVDRVVDPHWSKMHSKNFLGAHIYEHNDGHVVPFEDDFYRTFREFVDSCM